MIERILRNRFFVPLLILIAVCAFFIVNAYRYYRFPIIDDIQPAVAYPGDLITINGAHFGSSRNGAEVRIAGERPLSDKYELWSDDKIIVKVPAEAGSGMVTINTKRGVSNGVLFTNREHIPIVLTGPQNPGYPYMEVVEPASGAVGSLVTISGLNFGPDRGASEVYFTASAIKDDAGLSEDSLSTSIRCSEIDYDYESWDEQQVKVYIPDGASSGNIRIKTDRGLSNALYFEVTGNIGTKTFKDKMGFQVEYGVDVSGAQSSGENALDIWIPAVIESLEQRNSETVSEPAPLWDDYLGLMRYRFDNLVPGENYKISIKSWLERFEIETRVTPSKVKKWYNKDRKLYKAYTSSEADMPSDNKQIVSTVRSIVRNEKNPYLKASKIYKYLINNMEYVSKPSSSDLLQNFTDKKGNSYTYSILFSAMCRSAGVPSRPVAGVIVYNNKQSVNHYWAEFYIEGFGWIPVDAALGDGARFGNFPIDEEINPVKYYFGSIDNHHINLTKGIVPVKQIEPDGTISGRKGYYSLQTIYEESSGLIGYSSYWRAVRIIDWW